MFPRRPSSISNTSFESLVGTLPTPCWRRLSRPRLTVLKDRLRRRLGGYERACWTWRRDPAFTGNSTSEIDDLLRLILAPCTNRPETRIRLQLVAQPGNKVVGRTGLILLDRATTVLVLYLHHISHCFPHREGLLRKISPGVNAMTRTLPRPCWWRLPRLRSAIMNDCR